MRATAERPLTLLAWLLLITAFTFACRGQRTAPVEPSAGEPHGSPPAAAPAATAPRHSATMAAPAAGAERNIRGVHLLLDDGAVQWPVSVWEEHLDYARAFTGAGGFIVELVRADDLDTEKWQRLIELAEARQLRVVLRLATWQDPASGWWVAPPKDPGGAGYREIAARFARFIGALRTRRGLDVVVGNEPNRADEWGGRPDPAEYARYLVAVGKALHAAAPGRVRVLNAALDGFAPDSGGGLIGGVRSYDTASFLRGMHAAEPEVWQVIDLWATHAYPLGPFSEAPGRREFRIDDVALGGPRTTTPPFPGLYNRGINAYRWELFVLSSLGVTRPLPVLVTETGWRQRSRAASSNDAAGARLAAGQAARYLQLAFEGDPWSADTEQSWTPWEEDRDVVGVAVFALDGHPRRWGHSSLLELDERGRVKRPTPLLAALLDDWPPL